MQLWCKYSCQNVNAIDFGMKIFKFGGASVRHAEAIRNMGAIIRSASKVPLLVVVSAMGKTTNALENIVLHYERGEPYREQLNHLFAYHNDIVNSLLQRPDPLVRELRALADEMEVKLKNPGESEQVYDQVVSLGEILSTRIVDAYLAETGIPTTWIDSRKYILTDRNFKEGTVNWEETRKRILPLKTLALHQVLIAPGFVGATEDHLTTTLGREGSDYSAAIFASCLEAESVTIWKDVAGVMSADPKRLPNAIVFPELPFREAAEMSYYGASVIHPKTIKPLANKGIPLIVKSFDNISLPGTLIHECKVDKLPPLIVFKENQCLVSCHVTDYTFIDEAQLGIIFNALSSCALKINLMQNSAISFSFCVDFDKKKIALLIEVLSTHFKVYFNTGLTLITIKNYNEEVFKKYRQQDNIVLEQSSRSTLQVLVKSSA